MSGGQETKGEAKEPEEKKKPEAVVAPYKKKAVKEFEDLIMEYPIIGVVDMEDMPALQLQRMRAQLRDSVVLRMSKQRLMKLAIKNVKDKKKGIDQLLQYFKGMPAMLFTKENPFSLYKTINKRKSPAPAKPGQTAPKDIVVKAGPTPFAPGPVIGELGALKIKAGVEGGKVAIKEDATVVKEGEEIKPEVASILTRLGIEPMEIGLDLVAVYEEGTIYTRDVLSIDEEEFMNSIMQAAQESINLAVEAGFPTSESTELMIQKAHSESKALAREADIFADELMEEIVGRANMEAESLKSQLNIPETATEENKEKKEKGDEEKEGEGKESEDESGENAEEGNEEKAPEETKGSEEDAGKEEAGEDQKEGSGNKDG
ncbi:MAG: 50S ribosomal protein L10 [Candidatus Woesearchaeota archaeon]